MDFGKTLASLYSRDILSRVNSEDTKFSVHEPMNTRYSENYRNEHSRESLLHIEASEFVVSCLNDLALRLEDWDKTPPEKRKPSSCFSKATELCMITRELAIESTAENLWHRSRFPQDRQKTIINAFEKCEERVESFYDDETQRQKLSDCPALKKDQLKLLRAYWQNESARRNRVKDLFKGLPEFDERIQLQWEGFRANRMFQLPFSGFTSDYEDLLIPHSDVSWDPIVWAADSDQLLRAVLWFHQNFFFEVKQFVLELYREASPFNYSAVQQQVSALRIYFRVLGHLDEFSCCADTSGENIASIFAEERIVLDRFNNSICLPLQEAAVQNPVEAKDTFTRIIFDSRNLLVDLEELWFSIKELLEKSSWTEESQAQYQTLLEDYSLGSLKGEDVSTFAKLKLARRRFLSRNSSSFRHQVAKDDLSTLELIQKIQAYAREDSTQSKANTPKE